MIGEDWSLWVLHSRRETRVHFYSSIALQLEDAKYGMRQL